MAQGNKVGDDDLAQSNDSTAAHTLDGATDKHLGKIVGKCRDNGTDEEAQDGEEDQGTTTKDVGHRREARLKNYGGVSSTGRSERTRRRYSHQ